MDDLTAAYTSSEQPQHHCPLMTLPTEMRVTIYKFALQHVLDEVFDSAPVHKELSHAVRKSRGDPDGVPFYSGALALTHTNRTIRAESLDTLATLMLAHVDRLEDKKDEMFASLTLRTEDEMRRGLGFEGLQALACGFFKEKEKINRLGNSAIQVKYICYTMAWTKGG